MKKRYIQAGSNCRKLKKDCVSHHGAAPTESLKPPFWDQCGCAIIEVDEEQLPGIGAILRNQDRDHKEP